MCSCKVKPKKHERKRRLKIRGETPKRSQKKTNPSHGIALSIVKVMLAKEPAIKNPVKHADQMDKTIGARPKKAAQAGFQVFGTRTCKIQ